MNITNIHTACIYGKKGRGIKGKQVKLVTVFLFKNSSASLILNCVFRKLFSDSNSCMSLNLNQIIILWQRYKSKFYVLLPVHIGIIFVNNQLDAQFFFMYIYFYSLHVSGSHVPIIRRINCINKTSGICHTV